MAIEGDRATAEDLVRETFLQAWKGFDRFHPGTNGRAWLYRIFFFVLAHHRRRVRREPLVFEDDLVKGAGASFSEPLRPDAILRGELEAAFQGCRQLTGSWSRSPTWKS